jgi:hypothetical protein
MPEQSRFAVLKHAIRLNARKCREFGMKEPASSAPHRPLKPVQTVHRSPHPGGPLLDCWKAGLLTPGFPADAGAPTCGAFPLPIRSSGLLPLSFRLQWRGPCRLLTGFPRQPTTTRISQNRYPLSSANSLGANTGAATRDRFDPIPDLRSIPSLNLSPCCLDRNRALA